MELALRCDCDHRSARRPVDWLLDFPAVFHRAVSVFIVVAAKVGREEHEEDPSSQHSLFSLLNIDVSVTYDGDFWTLSQ